jgi:hypothetical protein
VDGIEPECIAGVGCPIPDPGAAGSRVLEIRALLNSLRGVIDPGTVCRICEVDRDDLELLARVETELQTPAPHEDS